MIRIVTGPIGSGKTTHRAILAAQNRANGSAVLELELDAIAHEVLEEIQGGEIDRARLAEEVFSNPDKLAALEAKLHPRVIGIARHKTTTFLAEHPDGVVVIETPIPLDEDEHPWLKGALVTVLDVDRDLRRKRVIARGMMGEQFDLRDKAQEKYDYSGCTREHRGHADRSR